MSEQGGQRYCPVCGEQTTEEFCPSDGSSTVARRTFTKDASAYEPDDIVANRYRITGVLGRGAFGAVYSARHTGTDQACALKMLTAENKGEEADANLKRFFREARITAGLNHPNTVRVFDVGQTDEGPHFLAMELLSGPTLDAFLDQVFEENNALPEPGVIDICAPILGSLGQAHEAGLVHRDIKPGNIILTPGHDNETVVKLLDFGIARGGGQRNITATGFALGTPAYMSPEQCRGGDIDGRSDVYAVGILAYRCATGRLPFEVEDPMALMFAHCRGSPHGGAAGAHLRVHQLHHDGPGQGARLALA